jgi:hypothetical protein
MYREEDSMKQRMRKTTSICLCILILAMAFAVAMPMTVSAKTTQVPFKGNFDGATVSSSGGIERIEMGGKASHLGKYTAVVLADMTSIVVIGIDPGSGLPIVTLSTSTTFTAANGDKVYADLDLTALYHPINGNFPSFTLSATITGGTGNFDGATGSFTGSGGQTSVPGPDNDLISGKFSGTISTVGSS